MLAVVVIRERWVESKLKSYFYIYKKRIYAGEVLHIGITMQDDEGVFTLVTKSRDG